MMTNENAHSTYEDTTGSGRQRVSCRTCGDTAITWQPYMGEMEWEAAKEAFYRRHPKG